LRLKGGETMASEDIGSLVVKIEANLNNFNDNVQNASQKIDNFGSKVKKMGAIIATAFVAKKVVDFGKEVVNAAMAQEKAENRLETLMKNVNGTTDEQIESLKKLAAAQQNLGVIGDEVTIAGQSQLATFQMSADTIATLTPAFQDLAVATYGANVSQEQMIQSGNLIGKVMGGQVGALSRVGVSFTDAQEAILKTGTESEKAAALVEVLSQNFGGLNKSTRMTTEGALVAMNNAWGDLKEVLGGALLPVLGKVAVWFSAKIPVIQDAVSSTFTRISEVVTPVYNKIMPKLQQAFQYFTENILPPYQDAWQYISDKIMPAVFKAFEYIVDTVLPPLIKIFKYIASEIIPMLESSFKKWMPKIEKIVSNMGEVIKTVIDFLVDSFEWAWPYIEKIVSTSIKIVTGIIDVLLGVLDGVIDFITGAFTGDWKKAWGGIKKIFSEIWTAIKTLLSNGVQKFIEIGKSLVTGLWNGIKASNMWFLKKITGWSDGIINAVRKAFGIASPSKKMIAIGKLLNMGLAKGIDENSDDPEKAAKKLADTILGVFDNLGDAVTKSLKKQYDFAEKLELSTLDAQTRAKVKAVQDQIDAIDSKTKAEEKALEKQEYENKLAAIDEEIAAAESAEDIIRLKSEKEKLISERKREQLLARREAEKQNLETQIENIKSAANAEENIIKNKYDALTSQDNLYAEARKMIVDGNNKEIITLLKTYYPQWQNAGQSFGESLINGLNSTKASIQEAVDNILSLVGSGMDATSNYTSYIVKSGDTLSAIAKKFGTTVAAIAALNDISNVNLIRTGKKLSIPSYDVGTNYVPFDTLAMVHKGEKITPADNNPYNSKTSNQASTQSINYANMFNGATFYVRSDNDAKLIAKEIYSLNNKTLRASGVPV
jgi:LysM repeat protein